MRRGRAGEIFTSYLIGNDRILHSDCIGEIATTEIAYVLPLVIAPQQQPGQGLAMQVNPVCVVVLTCKRGDDKWCIEVIYGVVEFRVLIMELERGQRASLGYCP